MTVTMGVAIGIGLLALVFYISWLFAVEKGKNHFAS